MSPDAVLISFLLLYKRSDEKHLRGGKGLFQLTLMGHSPSLKKSGQDLEEDAAAEKWCSLVPAQLPSEQPPA